MRVITDNNYVILVQFVINSNGVGDLMMWLSSDKMYRLYYYKQMKIINPRSIYL